MESFDKNTSTQFTLWTDTLQITVTETLDCSLNQDDFSAYISDIEGPIKLEAQLGNESFDFKNYAEFKKLAEKAFKLDDHKRLAKCGPVEISFVN